MLERFGAVFGVALTSSVFSAYGAIGSSSGFTDGFRPGITVAAALALLGALAGLAVAAHKTKHAEEPTALLVAEAADRPHRSDLRGCAAIAAHPGGTSSKRAAI